MNCLTTTALVGNVYCIEMNLARNFIETHSLYNFGYCIGTLNEAKVIRPAFFGLPTKGLIYT